MVNFITNTSSEALTYHECDNIPFVTEIDTQFMGGTHIKLGNKEYILADYTQVGETTPVNTPAAFGIKNNNTVINLEISYNEV
jgi:hypothetical protein